MTGPVPGTSQTFSQSVLKILKELFVLIEEKAEEAQRGDISCVSSPSQKGWNQGFPQTYPTREPGLLHCGGGSLINKDDQKGPHGNMSS